MTKMPKVSVELLQSIGEQLNMGIIDVDEDHCKFIYLSKLEKEMLDENPNLAAFAAASFESLSNHIENESDLMVANMIGRTVYLVIYNAIKQQMICDELK